MIERQRDKETERQRRDKGKKAKFTLFYLERIKMENVFVSMPTTHRIL